MLPPDYELTEDKVRIDAVAAHAFLTESYWAKGIALDTVARSIEGAMTVAILPARAGSKRIPQKNIRPFCGKPMIAWPIEIAAASRLFDRIVVSTDDSAVAALAVELGAEVPFVRPAHLSDDHASTDAVVLHAVVCLSMRDGGNLRRQHSRCPLCRVVVLLSAGPRRCERPPPQSCG